MTPVALEQAGRRLFDESCLARIGGMLPDPAAPNRDELPNRSVLGNESVRCRVRADCSQIIDHAGLPSGTHGGRFASRLGAGATFGQQTMSGILTRAPD